LYENARESLDVNWLRKKMGKENTESMRSILKEVGNRLPQDEHHQYAITLLAQLFFSFKVYTESNIWYEKAVDLHRRRLLKDDIVDLLINKKVIVKVEIKDEAK
jgi:hypothetical protein